MKYLKNRSIALGSLMLGLSLITAVVAWTSDDLTDDLQWPEMVIGILILAVFLSVVTGLLVGDVRQLQGKPPGKPISNKALIWGVWGFLVVVFAVILTVATVKDGYVDIPTACLLGAIFAYLGIMTHCGIINK